MALPSSFRTWSTNANYSAGSDDWSGQPTKVAHPGPAGGFVPGQGAAAQYFNDILHDLCEQDQALADNLTDFDPSAVVEFLTDGSVVAPVNAVGAHIEGCGGGAGGGSGCGNPGADFRNGGGGGGGGAMLVTRTVPIVGGETYNVDIGAGGFGAAGSSSATGTPGNDGADTTLTRASNSSVVYTARGAQKGGSGKTETYGAGGGGMVVNAGGSPVRKGEFRAPLGDMRSLNGEDQSALHPSAVQLGAGEIPQRGGFGTSHNFSVSGSFGAAGYSPEGFEGGDAGAYGSPTSLGSYYAGGCGGGGGAGPYGNGGDGGDGGAPNNVGAPGAGGNGTSAAANTGAGGGGGGSAGGGSSGTPAGGNSGNGGSGRMRIIWILKGNP